MVVEHLDYKVERLVEKWESVTLLIPATLLVAKDMMNNHGSIQQGNITGLGMADAIDGLLDQPLTSALQDVRAAARCQHCQPSRPLRVVSANRSGSSAEGLDDYIIGVGGPQTLTSCSSLTAPALSGGDTGAGRHQATFPTPRVPTITDTFPNKHANISAINISSITAPEILHELQYFVDSNNISILAQ